MSLIQSLEGRTLLSVAAVDNATVDNAAVQARLERLQALRDDLDAGRQALVAGTAGSRQALGALLSDAKEQFRLDRAAIGAARGDAVALAEARADAADHRARLGADLTALRAQFKREIADVRAGMRKNDAALRRGLQSFAADWRSEYRQKLQDARDRPEVRKLFNDARAIAADSDVTRADLQSLADAFAGVLSNANAPSDQSVDGLVASFRTALADDRIVDAERAELEAGARAVLRSANVPDAAVDRIVGAVASIVEKANVDAADVDRIAGDVRAALTALDGIFR